ncbi:MAG: [FeFe] hydrogenase, group A [Tepidibacter sp.]|jgi:ferredoxin hydrogenase|uniref:[FeFe] hydrogenase, group A n=1 Tax=Tepidibacter sp. TaxID=2529387 RepID=UPI0025D4A383|nr:[FeFe] hydrogenase, group A [Tepidibacter sp.]MCT4507329.1 [FeFe] hydrogenase, group A [Tepidibacter sp.]
MIVNIDKEICTGCRMCASICPVDAIEGKQGEVQSINEDKCIICGQCIQICSAYLSEFEEDITPVDIKLKERGMLETVKEPLFAAYNMCDVQKVKKSLSNNKLHKVVQCAPAVRVALAEDFGLELGTLTDKKLAAVLRKMGFDRVYDTNFSADLTIIEESTELVNRVNEGYDLPLFTSCCPAWVKFMEREYPELLNHLSTCKSPQQMAGAIFKTYGADIDNVDSKNVFSVSVMPCTCKKYECDREEMNSGGYKDVDVVITTRELAYLIKDMGIDFKNIEEGNFDNPLGDYTGAGTIFGTTGGVMEAAIRTAYELITKESIPNIDINCVRGENGVTKSSIDVGDMKLNVAVVSGLENVVAILEDIKNNKSDLHFIEVMTCPEGCISGGGQPKVILDKHREIAYDNRKKSIYTHDSECTLRKSHENSSIKKLYEEFLGEPLKEKSHHLLHTEYASRKEKN